MLSCSPILMVSYESMFSLSPRQLEVLQAAARGNTTRKTARALKISPHTVKTHLRTAMARLNAESITHAVAIAMTQGMVTLSDTPTKGGAPP
jgi:DNA-binding CsgD family transcriptional regulator